MEMISSVLEGTRTDLTFSLIHKKFYERFRKKTTSTPFEKNKLLKAFVWEINFATKRSIYNNNLQFDKSTVSKTPRVLFMTV